MRCKRRKKYVRALAPLVFCVCARLRQTQDRRQGHRAQCGRRHEPCRCRAASQSGGRATQRSDAIPRAPETRRRRRRPRRRSHSQRCPRNRFRGQGRGVRRHWSLRLMQRLTRFRRGAFALLSRPDPRQRCLRRPRTPRGSALLGVRSVPRTARVAAAAAATAAAAAGGWRRRRREDPRSTTGCQRPPCRSPHAPPRPPPPLPPTVASPSLFALSACLPRPRERSRVLAARRCRAAPPPRAEPPRLPRTSALPPHGGTLAVGAARAPAAPPPPPPPPPPYAAAGSRRAAVVARGGGGGVPGRRATVHRSGCTLACAAGRQH